jgi:hypothetical protein
MKLDLAAFLLGLPLVAAGVTLILVATGSPLTCQDPAGCQPPDDAWEPWRLGGGFLLLTAGSASMLSSLWRWRI